MHNNRLSAGTLRPRSSIRPKALRQSAAPCERPFRDRRTYRPHHLRVTIFEPLCGVALPSFFEDATRNIASRCDATDLARVDLAPPSALLLLLWPLPSGYLFPLSGPEGTDNRIKFIERMAHGLRHDACVFLTIKAAFPENSRRTI